MKIIIHSSVCEICANGIPKTKQCYSKGWDKCKGKYFEPKKVNNETNT